MKILLEIAKVANKKKVKKIEVFDEATLKHKNSKFNEFYEAVSSERFKNDREAAQQLYRCGPGDARYRQLKSRFKKRLLNTLFFLDLNQPTASTYDRTYYNCNKDWACVQILQSNNAYAAAENLAKSILTLALKYRFSDLVVNCARLLRTQAANSGDEKDFKIYDNNFCRSCRLSSRQKRFSSRSLYFITNLSPKTGSLFRIWRITATVWLP